MPDPQSLFELERKDAEPAFAGSAFLFSKCDLARKKVERVGSCHPARSCRDNSVLDYLSFPGLHIGPRIGAAGTMGGVIRVGLAHIAPIAAMLAHVSAGGNGA